MFDHSHPGRHHAGLLLTLGVLLALAVPSGAAADPDDPGDLLRGRQRRGPVTAMPERHRPPIGLPSSVPSGRIILPPGRPEPNPPRFPQQHLPAPNDRVLEEGALLVGITGWIRAVRPR